jgi:hypothetical protein
VVTLPLSRGESPELDFLRNRTPGNIPEAAVTLILDGVIAELMERGGITGETLKANHANLE